MDWSSIIVAILSCGIIVTLYEAIKYRRENQIIKKSEAENSVTDTQSKQLDLVAKYYEQVSELTEKSNTTIVGKIDNMNSRLDGIESNMLSALSKQALFEEYLDGPFHKWLAEKEMTNNDYTQVNQESKQDE